LARARNGLNDMRELAYTTAEHHPYWNLLYNCSEIDEEIEIVDIFRPSDQVLPFVQEAIKKKPKVIWLQEGIHNSEAEELARKEGITVIFNRCMLAEHQRLLI